MANKRIEYIDMLRVFACFLVVLTHSVMNNIPENRVYLGAISFICTPSSELFLALSGAVLLPVKVSFRNFYKRRFMKLLPPMIIWSVFGALLHLCMGKISGEGAVQLLINMPFSPVIGQYWFLYVMVGLYLFAPFISPWIVGATKRQMEIFLLIWLVCMSMPWLNLIKPGFYSQDGSYYWMLCYFGGFLGYWILGCYLKKYPIYIKSVLGVLVTILSILYFVVIVYMKSQNIDTAEYVDNLQIGSAIWVTFIFIVMKRISETSFAKRWLVPGCTKLAMYSFGIYLLHSYVVRDFVWNVMNNFRMYDHPIFESILIAIISIVICVVFMKILTLIYKPIGKWAFGLKVD